MAGSTASGGVVVVDADGDVEPRRRSSGGELFEFCPRDGERFAAHEMSCRLCGLSRDALVRRVQPADATRRWRKLLYIKQDFPDNYVDSTTFLDELQRNVNVRSYDYRTLVRLSISISQHIASVVLFAVVFLFTFRGTISANTLVAIGVCCAMAGYILWNVPGGPTLRPAALKGAIIFIGSLLGLSPVLRTLTQDTSSDTVWALSIFLLGLSVLMHDYSWTPPASDHLSDIVSLNAAIFASVILASRLPSTLHVFGLMLFAILWFAFFPVLRRHVLVVAPPRVTAWLTTLQVILVTSLLIPLSTAVAIIFVSVILFVTFVCPGWLIWIQQYKDEIRGPWDEARLTIKPPED